MSVVRNSKKLLLTAVIAAMFVGLLAVACGGDDAAGPEQTVQDVMDAMSAKDIDGFFALMDPEGLEQIEAMGMSQEDIKAIFASEMTYDSMEFTGIKTETEVSEDGQSATVTIVEGTMTVVQDGETTSEDVTESDESTVFQLVLRDGAWYLDISGMM